MFRPLYFYLVLLASLAGSKSSFSQNRNAVSTDKINNESFKRSYRLDSLEQAIKYASHDTLKIELMLELGNRWYIAHIDSAYIIWQKCYSMAEAGKSKSPVSSREHISFTKSLATSCANLGLVCKRKGDLPKALEFYMRSINSCEESKNKVGMGVLYNNLSVVYDLLGNKNKQLEYINKGLKIWNELGHREGMAHALNGLGGVYFDQGDIAKGLEYYNASLKIREEDGDKSGVSGSLNNLGTIFCNLGDYEKALEYFMKSLKIEEEIMHKKGTALSLNNIGAAYRSLNNFPKALEYLERGLKIHEELSDKSLIAFSLSNIGTIYKEQKNIPKALEYYNRSLKLQESVGAKRGTAICLNNIGGLYLTEKKYSQAIAFANQSMKLTKELGFPENIRNDAGLLYKSYQATGNYKLALENYELFIKMRDSLNNEKTRKASIKSQLKYEYEKQAAADSVAHAKESEIKNVELAKQKVEIKAKKNQQYALFGGLGLVIIFAGFMYNRFKITQKQKFIIESQKEIVEQQKHLVEEKQKEVLDSIHYAKRIQTAQLPNEKFIAKSIDRLKK